MVTVYVPATVKHTSSVADGTPLGNQLYGLFQSLSCATSQFFSQMIGAAEVVMTGGAATIGARGTTGSRHAETNIAVESATTEIERALHMVQSGRGGGSRVSQRPGGDIGT
jgi:hypothetical protein